MRALREDGLIKEARVESAYPSTSLSAFSLTDERWLCTRCPRSVSGIASRFSRRGSRHAYQLVPEVRSLLLLVTQPFPKLLIFKIQLCDLTTSMCHRLLTDVSMTCCLTLSSSILVMELASPPAFGTDKRSSWFSSVLQWNSAASHILEETMHSMRLWSLDH